MSRQKSAIDADLIRELAKVLNETDLTEIEVEQPELRIRVARQVTVQATVPVAAPAMTAAPAAATVPAPAPAPTSPMATVPRSDDPNGLKSPMVGTVFRGPAPGAKPFVEIGSKVNAGDRVLIVEAMKTFNDIMAHKSGTITAIVVEDKTPVEYGQILMVIE